eukprot:CAMPEP_0118916884 /NCGR_PEP_ID=MMETSP1166-20130328/16791_1 /TAXON_ID=1104430 /ORGANISM="Chrysoreinhardia sp, Strain CCMP3193" /LENGTH=56 /DNA_ID=CAMNT_0006856835 /DNA_START=623 /DNA_END=790 /DNA_ORIENTATION=-
MTYHRLDDDARPSLRHERMVTLSDDGIPRKGRTVAREEAVVSGLEEVDVEFDGDPG